MLKKIVRYSIGKYFELGILAFMLFHLASILSPEEYSKLMPVLLMVNYGTLIFSGLGGAYVKLFSLGDDSGDEYLSLYWFFSCVIGFLAGCAFFLLSSDVLLAFLVAIIGFLNSVRSFGQSYFRARMDDANLIRFNLLYPLVFLLSYASVFFYYKMDVSSYLALQAISLVLPAFFVLKIIALSEKSRKGGRKIFASNFFRFLVLNASSLIFLSADKFIILEKAKDREQGVYQLAENFSNIYYMGGGALLYLLTPHFLRVFKKASSIIILKTIFSYAFFVAISVFAYFLLSSFLIKMFFPDYLGAASYLFLQLCIKSAALSWFFPSLFFSGRDKESMYSLIQFAFILCGAFVLYSLGGQNLNVLIATISIFALFSSITLHCLLVVNLRGGR